MYQGRASPPSRGPPAPREQEGPTRWRAASSPSTCSPRTGSRAIRSPWCSTRRASTPPPCRPSPGSSTCRRRCSSCRRPTPGSGRACASSPPAGSCPSPAIPRSAPRCCWRCGIRPGAMPAPSAWRRRSGSSPAWSRRGATAAAAGRGSGCRSCRNISGRAPSPRSWHRASASTPGDIGSGRHAPSRHGVGPRFTCVPVASVAALDAARPAQAPEPGDGLYLYAPDPEGTGRCWRVRMFAPDLGVPEDPATGSAAAAFAGVLMQFEPLGEGAHDVTIRQGDAMGRPSDDRAPAHDRVRRPAGGGDRRRRRDRLGRHPACLRGSASRPSPT